MFVRHLHCTLPSWTNIIAHRLYDQSSLHIIILSHHNRASPSLSISTAHYYHDPSSLHITATVHHCNYSPSLSINNGHNIHDSPSLLTTLWPSITYVCLHHYSLNPKHVATMRLPHPWMITPTYALTATGYSPRTQEFNYTNILNACTTKTAIPMVGNTFAFHLLVTNRRRRRRTNAHIARR